MDLFDEIIEPGPLNLYSEIINGDSRQELDAIDSNGGLLTVTTWVPIGDCPNSNCGG